MMKSLVNLSTKRLTTRVLCKSLYDILKENCDDEIKYLIAATHSNSYCYYSCYFSEDREKTITQDQFNVLFEQPMLVTQSTKDEYISLYRTLDVTDPYSFMGTSWAIPKVEQVFSSKRIKKLNTLRSYAKLEPITRYDIFSLVETVDWLKTFLQLGDVLTYVSDGKTSKKAIWPNKNESDRKKLHEKLHSSKSYRDAVQLAGVFQGRLDNMITHAITEECAMMDKHGIFHLYEDKEYDLPTLVWCLLLLSDLNSRNAFTIQSQMHGGLNPFLHTFLDKFLSTREETDWKLIASLYPCSRTLENVSNKDKEEMLKEWVYRLNGIKLYLKKQWVNGVHRCTGDGGIHPAWTVPRRGSGVDSTGWNTSAGTFNNAIRHIRILSSLLDIPYPLLFTCPKLTAGDQAQWAYADGKEVDNKILALTELIRGGTHPWAALDGTDTSVILSKITLVASKHKVPLERFIGLPKERTSEIQEQHDMICGVAVDGINSEFASHLKKNGFAGATCLK